MFDESLGDADIGDSSRTLFVFGFYLTIVSLLSYALKERLFISQGLIALTAGIALGPLALDIISPQRWAGHDQELQDKMTFELARIVLGVQVTFTGINLPQRYLLKAWQSMAVVLLPLMVSMWIVSSTLIYLVMPEIHWAEALVIGAAVAPTDPVLAASVIKGRFAEAHVPENVVNLLAAESGANDGLGVPFMSLAVFLCKRSTESWSLGHVWKKWLLEAVLYECVLSVLIGIIIGFIARRTLRYAEKNNLIDHESFLAYGFGLAFLCLGSVGVLGSDDLLCAFVAGNSFTWDDWFKAETADHSFQDVIDELLDSAIFLYIGATIPWPAFGDALMGLQWWRVILVVLLILLFRRLPAAWLLHYYIPELKTVRESLFFGHFGPMGVGALYYVQSALQDLPEEQDRLRTILAPIIYAVVIGSTLVHGCSIPVALLGTQAVSGSATHRRTDKNKIVAIDINGDPSGESLHDADEAQAAEGGNNDLEGGSYLGEGERYRDDDGDDEASRAFIEGDEVVVREHDGTIHRHPLHRDH